MTKIIINEFLIKWIIKISILNKFVIWENIILWLDYNSSCLSTFETYSCFLMVFNVNLTL